MQNPTLWCSGSVLVEPCVCPQFDGVAVQARPPDTLGGVHVLGNVQLLQQQNLGPGREGVSRSYSLFVLPGTQGEPCYTKIYFNQFSSFSCLNSFICYKTSMKIQQISSCQWLLFEMKIVIKCYLSNRYQLLRAKDND